LDCRWGCDGTAMGLRYSPDETAITAPMGLRYSPDGTAIRRPKSGVGVVCREVGRVELNCSPAASRRKPTATTAAVVLVLGWLLVLSSGASSGYTAGACGRSFELGLQRLTGFVSALAFSTRLLIAKGRCM
jgi:hypothetical protein